MRGWCVIPGPQLGGTQLMGTSPSSWFLRVCSPVDGGHLRFRHQRTTVDGHDAGTILGRLLGEAAWRAGLCFLHEVGGVYGLHDEPGAGEQTLHRDWEPAATDPFAAGRVPCSMLWACSHSFDFRIQEQCGRIHTVSVPRGRMIVFDGRLWHGGGGHVSRELRCHGYGRPNLSARPRHLKLVWPHYIWYRAVSVTV